MVQVLRCRRRRLVPKKRLRDREIARLAPEVIRCRVPEFVHLDRGRQPRKPQAAFEPIMDARRVHGPSLVGLRVEQILAVVAPDEVHVEVALEGFEADREDDDLAAFAVDAHGPSTHVEVPHSEQTEFVSSKCEPSEELHRDLIAERRLCVSKRVDHVGRVRLTLNALALRGLDRDLPRDEMPTGTNRFGSPGAQPLQPCPRGYVGALSRPAASPRSSIRRAGEIRIVAANLLDEPLRVLVPDEIVRPRALRSQSLRSDPVCRQLVGCGAASSFPHYPGPPVTMVPLKATCIRRKS